jgi:hypothetical protein
MSVADRVLRGILEGSSSTPGGRARLKAAVRTRRLILRTGRDPLVRYRIGAADLELPLSHELPFSRAQHPEYGEAVGRIAAELEGPVVHIGANVGGTAAIVRKHADVPVLCVEGDQRFFAILQRNAARMHPAPELEHAFVDAPTDAAVERARGPARVVPGEGRLRARTLGQILDAHPRFREPALVKLDTDRMNVPILLAELGLLARLRPVLFFEYDPDLGADPVVFERLEEIGYSGVTVYARSGELVRRTTLDDAGAFAERSSDLVVTA